MKITLRGGYSNENVKNSFWYEYSDLIKKYLESGKRVAVITLAKPDGHYNKYINELSKEVEVIDSKNLNVKWNDFDAIFIPGGDSLNLLNNLKKGDFSLKELKKNALVLGDSAGAYILSSYFYHSPPGEERGKVISFYRGFNLIAKVITVAHTNNPVYTNEMLLEKVNKFAKEHNLKVLMLEENQEIKLDEVL